MKSFISILVGAYVAHLVIVTLFTRRDKSGLDDSFENAKKKDLN